MSITVGNMLAGPGIKTTYSKQFLIIAKDLEELNLTVPKEFCFGVTQDNNYLYYFVDGAWVRQVN